MEKNVVMVALKEGQKKIFEKPIVNITTEELTFLALMEILNLMEPEEPKEKKVAHRIT